MEIPQKIKDRTTKWFSDSTCGCIRKGNESRNAIRYLHTHIHGSIIQNSQKVEQTQVSINLQMDISSMVYLYNEILFCFKREENSDICYNIDEPSGH